jgi:hypothetical protein
VTRVCPSLSPVSTAAKASDSSLEFVCPLAFTPLSAMLALRDARIEEMVDDCALFVGIIRNGYLTCA